MDIGSTIRDGLKVEHLSPTKNVRMRIVEFPHAHEREEVHVVIKGKVYAEQGEDQAEFGEGDSFSWNACTPHLVRNAGKETAIVLISIYTESENGNNIWTFLIIMFTVN